jgi:hypothetical protein
MLTLVAAALAASSTVALADTSAVLFQVDMSVQEEIGEFDPGGGDTVVLRGSPAPLEWAGAAHPLTESVLNPGVYETIVDFDNADAGTTVEFKYVILAGGDDHWESINNRTFIFEGEDKVLDVVYFNDFAGYTEQDVTVTFTVLDNDDCASCTIDQFAIRGGSAPLNWDDDNTQLVDNGDETWSVSILFPAGTTPRGSIAYKYRAHANRKPERFDILGDPCTAWDDATHWMWQDLRNIYGEDCYANMSFQMDDSSPTLELPVDDWYPPLVGVADENPQAPAAPRKIALRQNAPNPFNPSTAITFELTEATAVDLSVYDLAGHKVATLASGIHQAGRHTIGWRPENLASGVYLYRLQAAGETIERTMALLK